MKAIVIHPDPVGFHPTLGELKNGMEVDLPDDFIFEKQNVFALADSAQKKINKKTEE